MTRQTHIAQLNEHGMVRSNILFNKSRVNVILPALDNDENMKDNIKYVIFCNLLVIRGCVGSCNSFEISG